MGRANAFTIMPIDQYAEVMGINPWEFNQIGEDIPTWVGHDCDAVWYQHPWQRDFLSRSELAGSIQDAEHMLKLQLGYWPGPVYTVDEIQLYPRPYNVQGYGAMGTPRGQWKSVSLDYNHVISMGIRNRALLDGGDSAVTYQDTTGGTLENQFTTTVITTITDESEIAIYFSAADRVPASIPVDESWRIRPVRVTFAAGTATIRGHKSLLIKPNLTERTKPANLSGTTADNFATTVDIYRVFSDTTNTTASPNQGLAIWEAPPGCETCVLRTSPICATDWDASNGLIKPQIEVWQYNREPDYLKINYLSGIPLVRGRVAPPYDKMIAYLATALLPSEKCGCERSNHILRYWRMYPSEDQDGGKRPLTLREIDDNPFGARRGARHAWQLVMRLQEGGMVSV